MSCSYQEVEMKVGRYFSNSFLMFFSFILLISSGDLTVRAAGEVDAGFNASAITAPQGTVFQTAVQPDGKIIVAGDFQVVGKYGRTNIARLNSDGTIDLTFNQVELKDNFVGDSFVR